MNETSGPCLQFLSGRAAILIRSQHPHKWDIVLGMGYYKVEKSKWGLERKYFYRSYHLVWTDKTAR